MKQVRGVLMAGVVLVVSIFAIVAARADILEKYPDVDPLQVTLGPQLIKGGDMESWNIIHNTFHVPWITGDKTEGARTSMSDGNKGAAPSLDLEGGAGIGIWTQEIKDFPGPAGTKYRYSMAIRRMGGSGNVTVTASFGVGDGPAKMVFPVVETTWKEFTFLLTVPPGAKTGQLGIEVPSGLAVRVDDFSLRQVEGELPQPPAIPGNAQ